MDLSAGTRPGGSSLPGRPGSWWATAAVVLLLTVGCGSAGSEPLVAEARPLVVWINQGVVGADSWTSAHHRAMRTVEEEFGELVETRFEERVSPGPPTASLIDELAEEGADLVFATSLPLGDSVAAAAARHPRIRFSIARDLRITENLGNFAGADEEPIYLAGMAAAASSRTGILGVVSMVPEPETIRHVNAFALGARSVVPGSRVLVEWIGSWWDPQRERVLARSMRDRGADVLMSGSVSTVLGEVARETGAAWVGHDADWSDEFGDVWISAAVPDWGPYYVGQVRDLLAERWRGTAYFGDMSDGYTDLATLGRRVPPEVGAEVMAKREQLLDGEFEVFRGPISDTTGRLRVADGAVLPLDEALEMDWFVAGVEVVGSGP